MTNGIPDSPRMNFPIQPDIILLLRNILVNMMIRIHIPFGNQPWQQEISNQTRWCSHLNAHLVRGFPNQPCLIAPVHILLIFHRYFNTSPCYNDFTERRIVISKKDRKVNSHSNSERWRLTIWGIITYIYIYIYILYIDICSHDWS